MASWDSYWGDEKSEEESDHGSSGSEYSGQSTDIMSASGSEDFFHPPDLTAVYSFGAQPGLADEDEPWVDARPPPFSPHGLYDVPDVAAAAPATSFGAAGMLDRPDPALATWDDDGPVNPIWAPGLALETSIKLEASAPPPSIVPLQWSRPPTAASPVQPHAQQYVPAVCPQPKARPFDSSSVVPPPLVCPFCNASPEATVNEEQRDCDENAETKRRSRRERKYPRANFKLGQWWKGFGYAGPRYCQRCSEVFRDHLIRQQSNSANCTRDDPCSDCSKVLEHFNDQKPWQRIDAREEENRLKRKQKQVKAAGSLPKCKKARVAVAAVTVAAALVAYVGFHPEYSMHYSVAPSRNCASDLPNVKNSIPVECPFGPVGTTCNYMCTEGHEKGVGNATALHVCTDSSSPNGQSEPAYTGGVCTPCAPDMWSAGGDMHCVACTLCPLGVARSCTASADAVCVAVTGPYATSKEGEQPPHVIDAATFTSPSGETYLFGGQGSMVETSSRQQAGDDQGYHDLLVKRMPPVGIEGVKWETHHPVLPDDGTGRRTWPEARAGAMVWRRDEHRWFMFGGNRGVTTGMSDVWSFDTSVGTSGDTPWARHCPDPDALIKPFVGMVGQMNGLTYGDFKHVCSTTNMGWLPKPQHHSELPNTSMPFIDEGELDFRGYAENDVLESRWPLPRSFGTITAVPCPPNSPSGCTTNQAWLFGGSSGYDHVSEFRRDHPVPGSHENTTTGDVILESFPLNDLWRLTWDEGGSVDWNYLGPYGPNNGYVGSRGQGDESTYFNNDVGFNLDNVGRPAFGYWISSRTGHAAWAAADGRLFIFGGVGLAMPVVDQDTKTMETHCIAIDEVQCPCAMLGDLWILYPKQGNDDTYANGRRGQKLDNPFWPNSGWARSMWGWMPGVHRKRIYPDIPGIIPTETGLTGQILGAEFCMSHFRRQRPLEEWPVMPAIWYNDSESVHMDASGQAPLARRAAVTWTDPDSQTGWLYGGETFAVGNELLSDLWKIDLSPAAPGTSTTRPFKVMEQVHTPPGKGAPAGLRMPGRAHAMSWVKRHEGDEAGPKVWPVIYGGAGERSRYVPSKPQAQQFHLWPEPKSADPWTTVYLEDVWEWMGVDDF